MRKRILVVEDQPDNRQIIRDMLPLLTMRSRRPRTAGKRLRQSRNSDPLRWVKPVRPGDTLSVRVTVLKAVPSKSKPDRGAVTSFVEVINQASEVVMTFKVVNIITKRSPGN